MPGCGSVILISGQARRSQGVPEAAFGFRGSCWSEACCFPEGIEEPRW